ncbi:MAG: ATP-binding cassette domain-containing protein [Anaerolineales bacterium]|nr:ATP-binding cassette domain-containing protein [Anaerolineales bacterium]
MQPNVAIRFENLSKTFGRGPKRVQAVKNRNLRIEGKQVYGFLGPNGAGKTTTIRLIMDLIRPNTLLLFMWLSRLFNNPDLINLYRFTPSFNVGNINAWIRFGRPLELGLTALPQDPGLYFSVAVVGI